MAFSTCNYTPGMSDRHNRRAAIAWVLLDWAASGFSTAVITLVVAYVERIVFADRAWGLPGGVIWAWITATAMLASALIAPWLSALADRTGSHQRLLLASVAAGSGGCLALAAVPPGWRLAVATAIIVATIGFDMAQIFTGSLLPRLAQGGSADRLSAAGFAAGYLGGAIALILATTVVGGRDALGLSPSGGLRLSFALIAGWWVLFSLPAAWTRMDDGPAVRHAGNSAGELLGYARSLATGGDRGTLGRVLLGAVIVLGVVQTAISQFSSLAIEQFHLDAAALVRLVLLVQFVALPGALLVGWLSTRWSRAGMLAICLAGWLAVLTLGWFVQTPAQLTALAVLLALVLGGIQSVIRATVAMLSPRGHDGATFGLMQVGTKLAGFAASLVFGGMYAASGHPRSGLLTLIAQLLVGWWILATAQHQAMPSTSRIE